MPMAQQSSGYGPLVESSAVQNGLWITEEIRGRWVGG